LACDIFYRDRSLFDTLRPARCRALLFKYEGTRYCETATRAGELTAAGRGHGQQPSEHECSLDANVGSVE
jgi:hypothetical protein